MNLPFTYHQLYIPVLSVMNQKGGVSKTETAISHAYYTGEELNARTLLVDLDMQCNMTHEFVGMEPVPTSPSGQLPPVHPLWTPELGAHQRSTVADIFDARPLPVLLYDTKLPNVKMVCGHPDKFQYLASAAVTDELVNRLWAFLCSEQIQKDFDVVIIDTGPNKSLLFQAALRASTHVLIPFQPEPNCIQGMNSMAHALQQEALHRDDDRPLKLVGLLPTLVDRTKVQQSYIQQVRRNPILGDKLLPFYIERSKDFPERDDARRSIFSFPHHRKSRLQSKAVCRHVAEQLGLPKEVVV